MNEPKRVRVDIDNQNFDGSILSDHPSTTGLVKIALDDGRTVVRHRNRVTALNDEAREFLQP